MALKPCKECGNEVSSDAKSCPKCGAKTPKKATLFTWLVVAGLAVWSYQSATSPEKANASPVASVMPLTKEAKTAKDLAETKELADQKARFTLASDFTEAVTRRMRDPGSFVVESLLTNHTGTIACMQYRSKNGFGGMNRESAILVDNNAKDATKASWRKYCTDGMSDIMEDVKATS